MIKTLTAGRPWTRLAFIASLLLAAPAHATPVLGMHVYGDEGGPMRFMHGEHEFKPALVCECCGKPPHGRDLVMEEKNVATPTVGEALAKQKVA